MGRKKSPGLELSSSTVKQDYDFHQPLHILNISGAVEVTERYVLEQSAMQEWSREEETKLGGRGGEGGNLQGIQRLWEPLVDGDLLPIPGVVNLGGGRQLTDGGQ